MKQRCTARKLSVAHALVIFCLGLVSAFSASATGFFEREQREFLPVEEAFQTSLSTGADGLTLHFDITPEHYLYEKQFRLTWPAGLEDLPELPTFSGKLPPVQGSKWVVSQAVSIRTRKLPRLKKDLTF